MYQFKKQLITAGSSIAMKFVKTKLGKSEIAYSEHNN